MKKILQACLCCSLFIFISSFCFAQESKFHDDGDFFIKQKSVYQSWLNQIGIGKTLEVCRWVVKPEQKKIFVKLRINHTTGDSAIYTWRRLQKDFGEASPLTLEEELFLKMLYIMEIEPNQAELSITHKTKSGQLPFFHAKIVYDKSRQIVFKSCSRSEVADSVSISRFRIKPGHITYDEILNNKEIGIEWTEKLLDSLLSKLKEYFEHKATEDTEIHSYRFGPGKFRVRVKNIKSEVISGDKGILSPHEYLVFTIVLKKKAEGLLFDCIVDGKYGFALWKQRENGFRDMHPKYEKELTIYAECFSNEILRKYIRKVLNSQ